MLLGTSNVPSTGKVTTTTRYNHDNPDPNISKELNIESSKNDQINPKPGLTSEANNKSVKEATNKDEVQSEHDRSDGESDNGSNNDVNSGPEFNHKRIILQRFTVYNSSTTMYIVGSNAKETLFRILEIDKDPNDLEELQIIEDKNYFYTRKDIIELLNGLDESIDGGIHKIAQGYGLLGLIKFTKGYYLSIITKCSQVAILGGHYVYHIDETKLIPLEMNYKRPEKYSDEEKLLSIFKYLDLSKTFYFSYTYDITNSLQTNFIRNKILARDYLKNPKEYDNKINASKTFEHNERFVWNNLLLKPILDNPDIATFEWFQPIIHGFIDQANISIFGKKIYITIIARRSHHFAGARFLKRGVNDKGNVANEIETEQIVSDMLISSFHDPKYGFFNNPRYTSFVQHRGSIPLYWTQDLNKLPKPPIEINLSDPFYQSSSLHFDDLFRRYGSPIIILNLIKTKEKQPRELRLNVHFNDCITYLNQFLLEEHKLQYYGFDMSKNSRKNRDVIEPLQKIASDSIAKTGFFHNGRDLESTKLQKGILRTNCIDCLDRTNAAQFITCKEALLHQLRALGIISLNTQLEYDSDLINILTEIFHDHGDTIAVQYGGSNLVNTMDSYRRINQWSSHTRDILNSVKRIYSNSFMDLIRQEAINFFLGNYVYDPNKPRLWELQNDFNLHNGMSIDHIWLKRSYMQWFNEHFLSDARFKLTEDGESTDEAGTSNFKLEPYPDYNDNWFNECYVPRKFQSLNEIFQYNMNSNSRYFPSSIDNNSTKNFDYSPFESRKVKHDDIFAFTKGPQSNMRSPIADNDRISEFSDSGFQNKDHLSTSMMSEGKTSRSPETQLENKSFATHPSKIKTFLTSKIEKLGYVGTIRQSSFNEESSDNDSSDLKSMTKSISENEQDSSYFIKPQVKDADVKVYRKLWNLENIKPATNLTKHGNNLLAAKASTEDMETYRYYASTLTNCSDYPTNEFDRMNNYNYNDAKLYFQYLGIDEDRPLNFNTEDDYFR